MLQAPNQKADTDSNRLVHIVKHLSTKEPDISLWCCWKRKKQKQNPQLQMNDNHCVVLYVSDM